ncbi:hypothetical protein BGZ49_006859 [Haplosporangium sp. Z 27]|nr:hypothetical protein BGZ49_006859 [Haplosporangium sp. Z 27]
MNAPIMQKVTEVITERSIVKTVGPRIAFSVRKTPYSRTTPTALKPQTQKLKGVSSYSEHATSQHQSSVVGGDNDVATAMEGLDQPSVSLPFTESTKVVKEDIKDAVPMEQELEKVKAKKKTRPKRPAKSPSKCLLAPLFRTTIPSRNRRQPATDTFVIGKPHGGMHVQTPSTTANSKLISKSRSRSKPVAPEATSAYSTNVSEASSEKIEQWYITNKAHLELVPGSEPGGGGIPRRRLMILNKPATPRQKAQLKIMRKHHWECRSEIEQNLRRNMPTVFSLNITRTKIDWEKIMPYITLMIQAAFEIDVDHEHLPVLGITLCIYLEQKQLSATACEELLSSWGLTELNARRFTHHLWDVLVSAAGESSVRGGKGVGFRVRQFEHRKDFKHIQEKLDAINKAPT